MQLSQIKPSLSLLSRQEALNLIIDIRKSRRTRKVKLVQVRKKVKIANAKSKKVMSQTKDMSEDELTKLINFLEEKKRGVVK